MLIVAAALGAQPEEVRFEPAWPDASDHVVHQEVLGRVWLVKKGAPQQGRVTLDWNVHQARDGKRLRFAFDLAGAAVAPGSSVSAVLIGDTLALPDVEIDARGRLEEVGPAATMDGFDRYAAAADHPSVKAHTTEYRAQMADDTLRSIAALEAFEAIFGAARLDGRFRASKERRKRASMRLGTDRLTVEQVWTLPPETDCPDGTVEIRMTAEVDGPVSMDALAPGFVLESMDASQSICAAPDSPVPAQVMHRIVLTSLTDAGDRLIVQHDRLSTWEPGTLEIAPIPGGPELVADLAFVSNGAAYWVGGRVMGYDAKGEDLVVLAEPAVLEEPGYRYYLDGGDLWREGEPWPSATQGVAPAPVEAFADDATLAALPFARVPTENVEILQSGLLAPDAALAAWRAASARREASGLVPLVVAVPIRPDEVAGIDQRAADRSSRADADAYLAAAEAELFAMGARCVEEGDCPSHPFEAERADLAAWKPTGDAPASRFAFQDGGKLVTLVLIRADPSDIPVLFGVGGWNACPEAPVHAALFDRWRAAHGAVPVFLGGDVIEMRTEQVLDADALRTLAWEQYLYAPDIVWQGTGTAAELANGLRGGVWFFWWD